MTGYTELVTHVRADAREQLRRRGAPGRGRRRDRPEMSMRVVGVEPGEGHRDHVAESMVIGTAIARFHRRQAAPTRSLTILPLRPTSTQTDRG